ncbi:hypothetical protein QK289_15595 [Exiguobacterium antarcticum]|uniref:Uncharacterized protein n=1 Tax=Exiguobacterium antarcticum TaxID=132920 RepID=A0ABT6R659_9BACL|nr:hypothetical protein [Exiguobacterium antarcticum]
MKKFELFLIQCYYVFFRHLSRIYPVYQKRKDSNVTMGLMVFLAMMNFMLLRHIVIPYNDPVIMLIHFLCISLITGITVKMDLDNHPNNSSENNKISLDLTIVFMAALIVPTIIINGFVVIKDQFEIAILLNLVGFSIISKEMTK